MSETANYNLYVEDGSSVTFLNWRKQMNGTSNSNMVKIDAALADLDSAISNTDKAAKEYSDTAKSEAISSAKSYTNTQIGAHNTDNSAHSYILDLIAGLTDRLNALADSDDTTLDQLSEIVDYIQSNRELIDAITTSKVSVSDIINNLTSNISNKPLSAAQGVVLKGLVDAATNAASAAQATADSKAAASHTHAYLPLSGGNMTGNIIMDNSASSQSGEPHIQWASIGGNKPYTGFAYDQSDGTFIICSMEKDTTTNGVKYYKNGLAIGGGSGNLFWKGVKVATIEDVTSHNSSSSSHSDIRTAITNAASAASSAQSTADGKPSAIFVAGTSAPSDTRLFWVDTTENTGGLKYYNGSAWVVVPVAYS